MARLARTEPLTPWSPTCPHPCSANSSATAPGSLPNTRWTRPSIGTTTSGSKLGMDRPDNENMRRWIMRLHQYGSSHRRSVHSGSQQSLRPRRSPSSVWPTRLIFVNASDRPCRVRLSPLGRDTGSREMRAGQDRRPSWFIFPQPHPFCASTAHRGRRTPVRSAPRVHCSTPGWCRSRGASLSDVET